MVDETSNLDDTDTPADGGHGANNEENHKQNVDENAEQTWYHADNQKLHYAAW